jgi:signal transduction histidine kinase
VHVLIEAGERQIELAVHNHGAPIDAALMPRLFEPFRRGDTSRNSGLGLGLFIAQQIVRAHGGTIVVRSTKQLGTRFVVRLPRRLAVR